MVVDTSVLLHVAFGEPKWEDSVRFVLAQERRLVAAPSVVEAQAVLAGRSKRPAEEVLDRLLHSLKLEVVAFTPEQASIARSAYLTFGKGLGHPAQLNFGDVFAYALARRYNDRLLFLGEDFDRTDLQTVRLPL